MEGTHKWTQEEMDKLFELAGKNTFQRESDKKVMIHWGKVAEEFGDTRTSKALQAHFRHDHPEGPHLKSHHRYGASSAPTPPPHARRELTTGPPTCHSPSPLPQGTRRTSSCCS